MDQIINSYRSIIKNLLTDYANTRKPATTDDVQHQLLFDEVHDHYQLFCVGWQGMKRIYFPVFHLDIINGKVWVQEDASDFDIVGELEARVFQNPILYWLSMRLIKDNIRATL